MPRARKTGRSLQHDFLGRLGFPKKRRRVIFRHSQKEGRRFRFRCLLGTVCAFVTFQFCWLAIVVLFLSSPLEGELGRGDSVGHIFPPMAKFAFQVDQNRLATIEQLYGESISYSNDSTQGPQPSNSAWSGNTSLRRGQEEKDSFQIVFSDHEPWYQATVIVPSNHVSMRKRLLRSMGDEPAYGGLVIDFRPLVGEFGRRIHETSESEDEEEGESEEEEEDGEEEDESQSLDEYYALDDDQVRGHAIRSDRQRHLHHESMNCRRVQEHRLAFPNCNEVHQLELAHPSGVHTSDFRYINHGFFREVFSYTHHFPSAASTHDKQPQGYMLDNKIAIKDIRFFKSDGDEELYEYVRMDGIVAERLTASPRTFDIFGYCGLSIMSEFFYHGDMDDRSFGGDADGFMLPEDLDDEDKVKPQNDLTPDQKLLLGLDMAQGLADLHGYSNALIIHDDVQMSQFLMNKDKNRLKINDFNRAEFPLWDDYRQEYCRYQNGIGRGTWRSPEEYKNFALTEAIDVWSLGNNLYGLLTGLVPFYETLGEVDEDDDIDKAVVSKIKKGRMPYLDPRYKNHSLPEAILTDVIRACYTYDPEERITIFEAVDRLQSAVDDLIISKGKSREDLFQSL